MHNRPMDLSLGHETTLKTFWICDVTTFSHKPSFPGVFPQHCFFQILSIEDVLSHPFPTKSPTFFFPQRFLFRALNPLRMKMPPGASSPSLMWRMIINVFWASPTLGLQHQRTNRIPIHGDKFRVYYGNIGDERFPSYMGMKKKLGGGTNCW